MFHPDGFQIFAGICFFAAILHTFLSGFIKDWSRKFPTDSFGRKALLFLSEVELTFGIWAVIAMIVLSAVKGESSTSVYLSNLHFTEPLFVFAIMTVASTLPVLELANQGIDFVGRILPLPKTFGLFLATLIIGPLLGSFITEPAAMTVTALILKERFLDEKVSSRFHYLSLAILFVNISIGGVLTSFAAPPVLMVAAKWNWNSSFMLMHFGWKAVLAVVLNAIIGAIVLRTELRKLKLQHTIFETKIPLGIKFVYLGILFGVVYFAHEAAIFLAFLALLLGLVQVTKKYNQRLRLQEAALVGFFLAGLVVLGGLQTWWLDPLIKELSELKLFLAATSLTAVTDNAALTYLGSLVEGISWNSQYALVAGAIAGGGLTVIANAPNPAGYAIMTETFGKEGISHLKLFLFALIPTLIAMSALWLL